MIQNSCSGERYGPLVSNYEKRLKYKHNFGLIQTVKAYKSLEEKKIMFYFNKLWYSFRWSNVEKPLTFVEMHTSHISKFCFDKQLITN